ncbi:glycosyltransferase family 2 protein, partial [Longimicrobium sp.]|uniref:glycosyltransferase family 2 protein n=1 Tax=Longimicrobium sp. TaxID=2029185 RepID=UPI002E31F5CE
MSAPRVSIGMPVYNGGALLAQALDATLAQTFRDVEVIISDNASTDDTEAVCRAAAARDPRVRYVRQPRNLGPLANFHYVLHEARGDYFMWAACDDLREPTFVEKLAAALDAAPGAVLASCQFDVIVEPGAAAPALGDDWSRFFAQPRARRIAGMIALDEHRSHKAVHIYGLARREALRRATAAVASVPVYSGWDVCTLVHLLCQGDVVIVPEP